MVNDKLVKAILKGDKTAISKSITLIENESAESDKLSGLLYNHIGKAKRIGITGPPGIGKSTLVNELIASLRQRGKSVGVIAVDPSSIFSGGAILGDRIRMQKIGVDENVFVRSMATRGVHGGLNRTAVEVADVLDASGKDYVIFETVGVGQSEIEIYRVADVTVVILSPESGDSIQAMKSGLMEIADIIVVNKSDLPGADAFVCNLRNTLEISRSVRSFKSGVKRHIPILKTQANQGIGIEELIDSIGDYFSELGKGKELLQRRKNSLEERIKSLILCRLENRIAEHPKISKRIEKYLDITGLNERSITPYELADEIIGDLIKK